MAKAAQGSKLATELSTKFDALFPAWPTIIATLLSLTIIIIILTKFLYNPVKKMHDDRKNYIQDNINSAEKENTTAASDREEANKELIKARIFAKEIIEKAKIEAVEVKEKRISLAEEEAKKVISNANKQIETDKIKFKEDSEKMIIEVALTAASKVVEKEVDNKTNRKIIEDFIKVKK